MGCFLVCSVSKVFGGRDLGDVREPDFQMTLGEVFQVEGTACAKALRCLSNSKEEVIPRGRVEGGVQVDHAGHCRVW